MASRLRGKGDRQASDLVAVIMNRAGMAMAWDGFPAGVYEAKPLLGGQIAVSLLVRSLDRPQQASALSDSYHMLCRSLYGLQLNILPYKSNQLAVDQLSYS